MSDTRFTRVAGRKGGFDRELATLKVLDVVNSGSPAARRGPTASLAGVRRGAPAGASGPHDRDTDRELHLCLDKILL